MKKQKITLKAVALCLALCLLTLVVCDLVLIGTEGQVYDKLIRLHIIANSDSEADQAVKLKIRDEILKAELFGNAETIEAAENLSLAAAESAVELANRVLEDQGFSYRATLCYGVEHYPTREYGETTLPAGNYKSLRIVLGEGEGQNWWCVLFPPMCTGAADSLSIAWDGDGSHRVFKTDAKRYKFKFKLLEWLFS
ncbi:MAG: stage II sporulation protein R [Clostridia bacterium]|nr:stage II sporulation protein R [Clostridia bacterium]MBQ7048287.1 stage II sporulation protein R [Clostridia bacterium]